MKKRKRQIKQTQFQYTLADLMMASATDPLPPIKRLGHIAMMWECFAAITESPEPLVEHWRIISDAINIMETLITKGPWLDCEGGHVEVRDDLGLLPDAITAMALAGERYKNGGKIRLDGKGMEAVKNMLIDYEEILEALPARTMITTHRETERRIREIVAGKKQSTDIVMAL
jgi:hypothetical protein